MQTLKQEGMEVWGKIHFYLTEQWQSAAQLACQSGLTTHKTCIGLKYAECQYLLEVKYDGKSYRNFYRLPRRA